MRKRLLLTCIIIAIAALVAFPAHAALVGYWELDDGGSNTAAADSSGNGNTGVLQGSGTPPLPQWSAAAKVGSAMLSLDGKDDFVLVDDPGPSEPSSLDVTSQITIALWVYHEAFSSTGQENYVLKHSTAGKSGYALFRYGSEGKIYFQAGNGAGTPWCAINVYTSANAVSQLDKWYHITATYDGNESKIYINGTQSGNTQTVATSIAANNVDLRIGDNADSPGYGSGYIDGFMDDVGIWNEALEGADVKSVMNFGIGAFDWLKADMGYSSSDITALWDLYIAEVEGPTVETTDFTVWSYRSGILPGDIGGTTYFMGDTWTYGGKYYIKLGSGLEGNPIPEPASVVVAVIGLGLAARKRMSSRATLHRMVQGSRGI